MRFRVFWEDDAEAELARLWLAARDRQRLTEVSSRIEDRLRRDPESVGESRQPGIRLLFDNPLWVEFRIDAADRIVRILTVWRYDG
jgi:hypothetical protein